MKSGYEIAKGDYSSYINPQFRQEDYPSSESEVSSDTAQRYVSAIREIADERIETRIRDGQDIAKVYNAEITNKSTTSVNIGSVTINGKSYDVTSTVVTSITARYNENDYVDISNDTVKVLDVNDGWCKICTYDGVQFYVLHRL